MSAGGILGESAAVDLERSGPWDSRIGVPLGWNGSVARGKGWRSRRRPSCAIRLAAELMANAQRLMAPTHCVGGLVISDVVVLGWYG
jgi:hypothetical protein